MRKPEKYTWIIFLALFFVKPVFSQVKPSTPELYSVTVDPLNNRDIITWHPSSSADVDYYLIGLSKVVGTTGYTIYSIDSVPASDTVYINYNTESDIKSIGYSIIAVNIDLGTRTLSNYDYPDSTIFLRAAYDSCNSQIILHWNDYNTWRGNIMKYSIYESIEGSIPNITITSDVHKNSDTIKNVDENTHLRYFVELFNSDNERSSRSNMAEIYTQALNSPSYINANSALEAANGKIDIAFTVDPFSQLSGYRLLRAESLNGPYETVSVFQTSDHSISVTDLDKNYLSGIFYYKLSALNNCNNIVEESNAINNILLQGTNNGFINQLNWNIIEDWPGIIGSAILYRWNLNDPSLIDSMVVTSQTSYTDDLSGYFSTGIVTNGEFCYQLTLNEVNNPHTSSNTASSNELCLTISDNVRMPNAFIPNNPPGENDMLRPLFLIQPERYILTIYNRWGNVIWQGTSPWDGKSEGKPVPEGVYVYYLQVYPLNKKPQKYSGHVTVIYR